MTEFWKIAVGISGLGAIVSFVLWSIYRQWLKLPVFQTMTKAQQFSLFRLVIILTFLFGIAGLGTYITVTLNSVEDKSDKKLVVLVDSHERQKVLDDLEGELKSIPEIKLDSEPIHSNWISRAETIATKMPFVVIAHFHSLRGLNGIRHFESEEELLLGLNRIKSIVPNVWFVIYSSGFSTTNSNANLEQINNAIDRLQKKDPNLGLGHIVENIKTVSWEERPSTLQRQALFDLIKNLST